MVFERSPYIALLCVIALLSIAPPCHADFVPDPVSVSLLSEPATAPVAYINDSPAEPVDRLPAAVDIPANESLPDLTLVVPMAIDVPANEGPSVQPPEPALNVTAMNDSVAGEPVNAADDSQQDAGNETACPPIRYEPVIPTPEYVVKGTIYSVSPEGRCPWAGERLRVYVNGISAKIDGSEYSVRLPGEGAVEVTLEHDCGYLLGRSEGYASEGTTCIDVEAPALEISGDVYEDDIPAGGACLFVYLNDQPIGPFEAAPGRGPMFSVALPGGHPGDHVSITASRDGRSGIVSQDMSGYSAFLTVNLKGTATYLPYTAPYMAARVEKSESPANPPRYDDRLWGKKFL